MKGIVTKDFKIEVDDKLLLIDCKVDPSLIGSEVDFIIVTDDVTDYARIVDYDVVEYCSTQDDYFTIPGKQLKKLIERVYSEGFNQYEITEAGLDSFDPDSFARWQMSNLTQFKNGTGPSI